MLLSEIVQVTITVDSIGVQRAGFGVPLLLSHTAAWVERVRFYTGLAAVGVDFATTTPEYKAAAALFSQKKKPAKIAIGRRALKPTQKYEIVPTVLNATEYKVRVGANTVTFTSDGSATNDEITDGLLALINALSGDMTTATTPGSAGSHILTLTANAAGNFDAVEVLNPDLLALTVTHADPGIATDLAAIALENNTWYFLLGIGLSKAEIMAAAAYAEANKKIFIAASPDTRTITLAEGADADASPAKNLKTLSYKRTALIYHPAADQFADAAWVGGVAPISPGGETFKFKNLVGVATVNLTGTHQTNANAKNANHYQLAGGVGITAEGKAAQGTFLDITRFLDWLEARMQEDIFAHLAAADKISFDDSGIAVIEADIRGVLDEGIGVGGIAANPKPVVTVPLASAVSAQDKADRKLSGVRFSATLSGALHSVQIAGVVSL